MIYTNDEIKAIAEQQLATADWSSERQKEDTTLGFRMGFAAAIRMHNLQQADVVGSGDGFPDEDDEDYYQPEPECQICGKVDGHHRGCPEDDSPFALLERRGFD